MKKYDALIIGFGKGGKTLAGALASAGKSVAVAERSDKMYGGTCINVGCIPSKSLVHSAELSAAQGGGFEEKARRYRAAVQEKEKLTGMLRKKNFEKLDSHPNITVLTGAASFTGPKRAVVATKEGAVEIEADQVFLNTGSRPFVPPIPGLKESRYFYLSETLLDLEDLPKRLVIIGGGYIGMEHMLYAVMRIAAERDQNRIFFDPEATQGVYFGEAHHQSPTPRVQEVSDLLARTRVHHQFFPNILTTLWVKFAGNVSNNLPQAILGAGVGIYLVSTHAAFIAQKMWDEVARLAQTKGIDVGPFEPEAWAGRKNARFSTLQDLDHKRHTEVDMLAGTVIRLSQEAGLAAPYCTFAYHAIKALEEKNDGRFDFDTMC